LAELAELAGTEEFTRAGREDAAARARLFPPRALMKIRGAQILIAKADERRVEYGRIDLLPPKNSPHPTSRRGWRQKSQLPETNKYGHEETRIEDRRSKIEDRR
jgi:hypothetical protein